MSCVPAEKAERLLKELAWAGASCWLLAPGLVAWLVMGEPMDRLSASALPDIKLEPLGES